MFWLMFVIIVFWLRSPYRYDGSDDMLLLINGKLKIRNLKTFVIDFIWKLSICVNFEEKIEI